jgi:hypothetical protein
MIKWNWGTGIVIAMVVFMVFIVTLVVIMTRSSDGLEEAAYYEKGNRYEQRLDEMRNAESVSRAVQVLWNTRTKAADLIFAVADKPDSGYVLVKRPSDKRLDFIQTFIPLADTQRINWQERQPGLWKLELSWYRLGKKHFLSRELQVP